jgi:hypothetical protein
MEIHIAESLISEPSASNIIIATEKFKMYKSQGTDQIPAYLDKAGGKILNFEFHKVINYILNKE